MSVTVQATSAVTNPNTGIGSPVYTAVGTGTGFITSTMHAHPNLETWSIIDHSSKIAGAIEKLSREVSELKWAVENLTDHLIAAEERGANSRRRAKSIQVQQSDRDIKKMIKKFFEKRHGETIYPSDIADELQMDYDRIVRLVRDLENDGKIAKI
jgi:Mg2+ and Co2+ transporter CorA